MARPTHSKSAPKLSSSPRGAAKKSSATTKKVRYAVVGLGHIAQAAVLPAFAHAGRNSELAAIISDDAQKLKSLGDRYGVQSRYCSRDLRRCLAEGIDVLYVATPNSEHEKCVLAAAQAGVHVLCEKPLGVTEPQCSRMIQACQDAGVLLMTAYRLHFEAANLAALQAIRSGRIGDPRIFASVFTFQVKDEGNIRLRARLGGGPLHDIGIYCINAARTAFDAEPVEVMGWAMHSGDARFREVDETVCAQLRFPGDRVATFVCGFGAAAAGWYQVIGTKGDVRVDPAFEYSQGLKTTVTVNEKKTSRLFPKRDQFAAELIYFSDCIHARREPEPSGWEGLADVRVIQAIQQSIARGIPLSLPPSKRIRHPEPDQRIDRPAVSKEPKLVRARAATA